MRVIFLTHDFPRWSGDQSGTSLLVLARALRRRGIQVRVVAPGDQEGVTELEGVPVRRVRSPAPGSVTEVRTGGIAGLSPARPAAGTLIRLWHALRSGARQELASGADLVHAHSWIPSGLAAPAKLPLVLSVYPSDAALLLRHSRITRALARPVFQRARVVTSLSREVGGWIESGIGRHVPPERIHGLPLETRGHPWTRGGGGAVTIARLEPAARIGLALETVAVLASCGHDVPLTIIGSGPERSALEEQAAVLGVAALVRFTGDLSPEEARRYLDRADLMLFTAKGDGVAPAAIEALVSGIPSVACWDSGAAVEMVPESGPGRLTLPAPESLADSILELQSDADRLAMARLVGESWRARLAPDHVAEIWEGWYREVVPS